MPVATLPRTAHPSTRCAAWLLTKTARALTARQAVCVDAICAAVPAIAAVRTVLEHELLADADFATRAEAHRAVAEYIAVWYNAERRHST